MYYLTKVLKVHRKMFKIWSICKVTTLQKLELIFSMKMISVFERKKIFASLKIILLICLQHKERGKMLVEFSPSLTLIWRYIWVIKVLLHYILCVASTLKNWLLSFKGTPKDLSSNCFGNSKSLKALYFLSPNWILCHKNIHHWVSLVAHR